MDFNQSDLREISDLIFGPLAQEATSVGSSSTAPDGSVFMVLTNNAVSESENVEYLDSNSLASYLMETVKLPPVVVARLRGQ